MATKDLIIGEEMPIRKFSRELSMYGGYAIQVHFMDGRIYTLPKRFGEVFTQDDLDANPLLPTDLVLGYLGKENNTVLLDIYSPMARALNRHAV